MKVHFQIPECDYYLNPTFHLHSPLKTVKDASTLSSSIYGELNSNLETKSSSKSNFESSSASYAGSDIKSVHKDATVSLEIIMVNILHYLEIISIENSSQDDSTIHPDSTEYSSLNEWSN